MGIDKPFNCDVSGCGMSFTNEDHLTVHRKKHEMCLTLNSENSVKSNSMTLFVDQTPTPTRFIRNCEEVGLFQDLQSVNPFEEHFRKAAESVKLGHPPIVGSLNVPPDGDILNTPSVLVGDLEGANSLTVPLNVLDTGPTAPLVLDDDDTTVNKPIGIMKELSNKDKVSEENGLETNLDSDSFTLETKVCSDSIQSTVFNGETPVISFLPTSESTGLAETSTSATEYVNLPSTNISLINATEAAQSSNVISSAPMVHLILKLPDGSSIPVQVPTLPTVVDTSQRGTSLQKKTTNLAASSSKSISNNAKLKLRESLTQNLSGENRALRLMNEQVSTSLTELHNAATDSLHVQSSLSQNKRRFGHEDNDMKRQKFLERNRAAATRCRQKRKQWVQSLESKAEELAVVNQHLQNEVALLRTEVSQLKSMLLAHKDCPVTQQQQKHIANLNASSTMTALVLNNGSKIVAAPSTPTKTTTTVANVSLVNESSEQPTSVIYRTIMSKEQALALLTGNASGANRKLVIRSNNMQQQADVESGT